jgi:polyphosphate kinase
MCTLRPGVKGMSDRITVTSIVGRYLEHARAFVFHNGGDEEVYLASADWMGRNLDKRIELMFPIESPAPKRKVLDALAVLFRDTVKGRRLGSDGVWRVPDRPANVEPFEAQTFLHEQAERLASADAGVTFEPLSLPR